MKTLKTWVAAATMLALSGAAYAAPISLTGTNYGEGFNGLVNTGTGPSGSLPSGWQFLESGDPTVVDTTYGVNPPGPSLAGDTYSFGMPGAGDRALGTMRDGFVSSRFGVSFQNNTAQSIRALRINFFGEQWFLGSTDSPQFGVDRLDFGYSTIATDLVGGYVDFDMLDFVSPVNSGQTGFLDGNRFRRAIGATIDQLDIAPSAVFWLRWTDFGTTGVDDGLGIDDFQLIADLRPVTENPPPPPPGDNSVPLPGTLALSLLGLTLMGRIRRRA